MRTVLITGAAGFIGSHTCIKLLDEGYTVFLLDNFSNSSPKAIRRVAELSSIGSESFAERIKIFNGDILNIDVIDNVFQVASEKKLDIEAVIHFAGLKSVADSVKNPLEYWNINFGGTRNLLEVMSRNKCYSLIFSSSATVYGSTNLIPISETAEINPSNPYGATKAAIEIMLANLAECSTKKCPYQKSQTPWKIARLRYFNPVGAHPSGRIGENPNGSPNNLFPLINQVAIGTRSKIEVYGNDWDTFDGSGIRDYIHVMDLVDGHLAALEFLRTEKPQLLTLNLGSGKGYSVLEVISCFEKETKKRIPYNISGRRAGDIAITIANPKEAFNLLGWSTRKSLNDMCHDSWKWQKNNPTGYNQEI